MSWNKVDDKLKKDTDARFVSCEEDYELDYVRDVIEKSFPGKYTKVKIDAAIAHCCKSIKAPRPRKDFVECLRKQLS
ncbi:MAG: hypothetical protein ACLQPD_05685 [Desulfomonilaceae bacterium]